MIFSRFLRSFIIIFMLGMMPFLGKAALNTNPFIPSETAPSASSPYGTLKQLLNGFQEIQSLQTQIENQKINLQFEEDFDFPSLNQIEEIKNEIENFQKEIQKHQDQLSLEKSTYENKKNVLDLSSEKNQKINREIELLSQNITVLEEQIRQKNNKIKTLQEQIPPLQKTYNERKRQQLQSIEKIEGEILVLEEELTKSRALMNRQISRFFSDILILIAFIALILFLRYFSGILIQKFSENLSLSRRNTLIKLNKVIFNIILGIVLVGIIFAQIITILPFIAIFGTGIAFAVRDSIACFVGWFIIGTERGYRAGHIIKVGDTLGRVKDIGPILTRLQDLSEGRKNGKIISLPNKTIMEKEIINYSQGYEYISCELKIPLTENMDREKSEKTLREVSEKILQKNTQKIKEQKRKLERSLNLSLEELQPQIYFEPGEKNPFLLLHFFAPFEEKDSLKTKIYYDFLKTTEKGE